MPAESKTDENASQFIIDNHKENVYNSAMKTKKWILLLVMCLLWGYSAPAKDQVKLSAKERREAVKNLSHHHKYWFDMVTYISTAEERAVFLKLTSDRDRDIFIQSFWLQRDPTPGTPENEYQNEIESRFEYVNKEFAKGVGRPGWMTDMGKFYMILGKPSSIDSYDSKPGLYPARIWFYYGDKRLGLPTYFNITFYKPFGTTEWKLYNPAMDGPQALLIQQAPVDPSDYQALYMKIYEIAPTLASASVSMIPQEASGSSSYGVLLRSNLILNNIYESPKRTINVAYATNFLNYKGFVNVDASINYIENSHLVSVSRYQRFGFNFINISVKPKQISVGFSREKDQYYFNLELSVSLKKGDDFVYQYSKNFDFYIPPDEVNNLKGNGIVVHDSFPVLPGKYTLMVFIKNTVGKEFAYFDTEIDSFPEDSTPRLSTPVVGHKVEPTMDNFFFPYRIKDSKLFVDSDRVFRLKEKPVLWVGVCNLNKALWETGKVVINLWGLNERVKFSRKFELPLKDYNYNENINFFQGLSEEGLNPDYYDFEVKLVNQSGITIDKQSSNFTVSPLKAVAYATETYKRSRIDNPYFVYYILGSQYENAGDLNHAEIYFEKCVNNRSDFAQGFIAYLNVMNRLKKYTKVLVEVEKLKKIDDLKFDYFFIKGSALYGMKDYNNALDQFLKANELYNSDIRVLNFLGFTLANLKEYKEAIKAFEASLSLESKQPFIRKVCNEMKQKHTLPAPKEQK